jgi:hypothetical protein
LLAIKSAKSGAPCALAAATSVSRNAFGMPNTRSSYGVNQFDCFNHIVTL